MANVKQLNFLNGIAQVRIERNIYKQWTLHAYLEPGSPGAGYGGYFNKPGKSEKQLKDWAKKRGATIQLKGSKKLPL